MLKRLLLAALCLSTCLVAQELDGEYSVNNEDGGDAVPGYDVRVEFVWRDGEKISNTIMTNRATGVESRPATEQGIVYEGGPFFYTWFNPNTGSSGILAWDWGLGAYLFFGRQVRIVRQ